MVQELIEQNTDLILSATGRPFTDLVAAEQKASILSAELGEPYIVADYPLGGYAVIRKNAGKPNKPETAGSSTFLPPMEAVNQSHAEPHMSASAATTEQATAQTSGDIVLRPAWRSFWKHNLMAIFGAVIFVSPYSLLYFFFVRLLNVYPDSLDSHLSPGLLHLLSVIGLFMILSAISHMLVLRQTCKYVIGQDGIETDIGILSRQSQRIEYRHVRSVNVRQSVVERLLDIGLVEFSSAAREGGDLVFHNVYNPRGLQDEVYKRIHLLPRQQGGDE